MVLEKSVILLKLHAPFYKSNGSQNPYSIRKEASSIESKNKIVDLIFLQRPLTIESWIHTNEHQMPKPTCIKFKVFGVYGPPHSIEEIPRGIFNCIFPVSHPPFENQGPQRVFMV